VVWVATLGPIAGFSDPNLSSTGFWKGVAMNQSDSKYHLSSSWQLLKPNTEEIFVILRIENLFGEERIAGKKIIRRLKNC
jgi:hypothetical protein